MVQPSEGGEMLLRKGAIEHKVLSYRVATLMYAKELFKVSTDARGGCKILSKGQQCRCFLCLLDAEIGALLLMQRQQVEAEVEREESELEDENIHFNLREEENSHSVECDVKRRDEKEQKKT